MVLPLFCYVVLSVLSRFTIISLSKGGVVVMLSCDSVSSLDCLLVLWGCLRFVNVVFPGHTHLLFLINESVTGQINIYCYSINSFSKYISIGA